MRKQYGWGVRGWGASQNNPMSTLIKSSNLYLSADKADGQPFVKLEPRTVGIVSNTDYTQNISIDSTSSSTITISGISSANWQIPNMTSVFFINLSTQISIPNAFQDGSGIMNLFSDDYENSGWEHAGATGEAIMLRASTNYGYVRMSNEKTGILAGDSDAVKISKAQTYLRTNPITIRYQLATPIDTLNVPFKNPWKDLKGTADCTLVNFAGTTADGYTVETINGKTNTYLNLDGLNSFGQFANMDVLNPVGTDDFCQMVVFRPDDTNARFYGVTRNLDSLASSQYGLFSLSPNFQYVIEGNSIIITTINFELKYILYGRINGRRFAFVDGVEVQESANTSIFTSKANTQLGCRSNSVDGLTKTSFAKGLQGDIAFWKGTQGTLDKGKIIDLVKRAMKQKYGLGV